MILDLGIVVEWTKEKNLKDVKSNCFSMKLDIEPLEKAKVKHQKLASISIEEVLPFQLHVAKAFKPVCHPSKQQTSSAFLHWTD